MSAGATVTQVIKSWITGEVLFRCEVAADMEEVLRVKVALEAGVKAGAYLSRAYLPGAYLPGADLSGANLSGANLSRAYLSGAYLGTHKIIQGGTRSDCYGFLLTNLGDEGWRIKAGCRNFTIADARHHWSTKERDKPSLNTESLLIVENLLALAKVRGWEVEAVESVAR